MRTIKKIPCIERAVAQKLIHASMKRIGPRARCCVDDPAGGAPIFSRVIAPEDRHLFDCIYAQAVAENAAGRPVGVIVDADTVHAKIVLVMAAPKPRSVLPPPWALPVCTPVTPACSVAS